MFLTLEVALQLVGPRAVRPEFPTRNDPGPSDPATTHVIPERSGLVTTFSTASRARWRAPDLRAGRSVASGRLGRALLRSRESLWSRRVDEREARRRGGGWEGATRRCWAAAWPAASSAAAHRRGPLPQRGQARTRPPAVPPSRTPVTAAAEPAGRSSRTGQALSASLRRLSGGRAGCRRENCNSAVDG